MAHFSGVCCINTTGSQGLVSLPALSYAFGMEIFPRRQQRKEKPAACPFCEELVRRPAQLAPDLDCSGGRCNCGALYILDLTGKSGGQALVDGLTLMCDGDLDGAMKLQSGIDYQLERMGYRPRTHSIETRVPRRGGAFGTPKLWFFRRLP